MPFSEECTSLNVTGKQYCLNTDCITESLVTKDKLKKTPFRLHTDNDMIHHSFSVLHIKVFFSERPKRKRVKQ